MKSISVLMVLFLLHITGPAGAAGAVAADNSTAVNALKTLFSSTDNTELQQSITLADLQTKIELSCSDKRIVGPQPPLPITVNLNGKNIPLSCETAKTLAKDLSKEMDKEEAVQCRAAYSLYNEKRTERASACSKVDCGTDKKLNVGAVQKCEEHLKEMDQKITEPEELEEFFESCPFFAKKMTKDFKAEEKDLKEDLEKIAKDISEKKEAAIKQAADAKTELATLQSEIKELEGQSQEALSELGELVAALQKGNADDQAKVRSQIAAISTAITERSTTGAAQLRREYQEILIKVETDCYRMALEMAQAEAMRLKSSKELSRADLNLQLTAGGAVEYLKAFAEDQFVKCQESAPYNKPKMSAKDLYEAEVKKTESEIKQMLFSMQDLKQQHLDLIQELPKAEQNAQSMAYAKADTYVQQANVKKQQLGQLFSSSQALEGQLQQEMAELTKTQFELTKKHQKAKARVAKGESVVSVGRGDEEDFDKARSAVAAEFSARDAANEMCCDGGKSTVSGVPDSICKKEPKASDKKEKKASTQE